MTQAFEDQKDEEDLTWKQERKREGIKVLRFFFFLFWTFLLNYQGCKTKKTQIRACHTNLHLESL